MRKFYLIGLMALSLPSWSAESIVLNTGFRLPADRHEVENGKIRLYSNGGVTEISASLVASIEGSPDLPQAAAPAPAPEVAKPAVPETPRQLASEAADKYALPDSFVAGVMRAESAFRADAVSPKGAVGLMQLMPETARELGADPRKPAENADAGARYLRELLAKYEDRPDQVLLALAAYNAGPAAVERYHGVPPFRETREYILRVLKAWNPSVPAKP